MAWSAAESSVNVTKPKPRDRPVSPSLTMTASWISPKRSNAVRRLISSVVQARPPTCSFLDTGSLLRWRLARRQFEPCGPPGNPRQETPRTVCCQVTQKLRGSGHQLPSDCRSATPLSRGEAAQLRWPTNGISPRTRCSGRLRFLASQRWHTARSSATPAPKNTLRAYLSSLGAMHQGSSKACSVSHIVDGFLHLDVP